LILITAFIDAWKRPFDYEGVTTRKNYWFYCLSSFFLGLLLEIIKGIWANFAFITSPGFDELSVASNFSLLIFQIFKIIDSFYSLGSLVISPSIIVRRLRDAGKQWQWIFLLLIPVVGWIWLIFLYCQPTKRN
tara:strand:+ start:297 stop:695 length:399 start_codon:yes stop_codon:yes gene_type:complete